MDKRLLGQIGENTAADILRAKGYRILKQNYRCRHGEIDLIAMRDGVISFVEVKTRQNYNYGRPCEAIDENKKSHIRKAALCFLDEMRDKGQSAGRWSFHVMEVVVEHTVDAF
ncbi:MAG: YraN family protein [Firmicutes bacterium]|nr:YraN family protein [Bacillota bacterium]